MGLGFAGIELVRGADVILVQEGFLQEDQMRRCTLSALLDSGATMLAISGFVRQQLALRKLNDIGAEFVDSSSVSEGTPHSRIKTGVAGRDSN
ncbi:MAG: hypothetical protein KME13_17090 [Myxacorys californica WJT36-NPBG1]|jgi:hypothetical protein|nr:hypothetical protein [Myxacorys californica WJT36-NPBG1]